MHPHFLNYHLMDKHFSIILTVLMCFLLSCNSVETKEVPLVDRNLNSKLDVNASALNKTFTNNWTTITKDFTHWYNYTYYNVRLSQDFIGLDIDSSKIDKITFLNKLNAGNVVAFNIKILNGQPVYRLYKLNSNNESIRATIKQMASTAITHFKMEGRELPKFNFTDLNGRSYNKLSTKGKIMVLKCWFIHCVACVREFPELNKLADENNRTDVQFISLASDSKKDLENFLKTKEFKYAVIPEMRNYMEDKLNIMEFPTHILIGTNGKIIKVVNAIDELEPFLNKETAKTSL